MNREEAIEAIKCNWPDSRYTILREALDMAISALRQQENECVECSGIVYRQTNSGKIVPLGQRCGAKITPPCYVPDGDGCSYQIYGDNNDEPIDRCKSCPLCQSDKVRHKQDHFREVTRKVEPLTRDELRQMDGEPVWVEFQDGSGGCWGLVHITMFNHVVFTHVVFTNGLYCTVGKPYYGKTWLAYCQKPEEGAYVRT